MLMQIEPVEMIDCSVVICDAAWFGKVRLLEYRNLYTF